MQQHIIRSAAFLIRFLRKTIIQCFTLLLNTFMEN